MNRFSAFFPSTVLMLTAIVSIQVRIQPCAFSRPYITGFREKTQKHIMPGFDPQGGDLHAPVKRVPAHGRRGAGVDKMGTERLNFIFFLDNKNGHYEAKDISPRHTPSRRQTPH
jgi:hypothetical protein